MEPKRVFKKNKKTKLNITVKNPHKLKRINRKQWGTTMDIKKFMARIYNATIKNHCCGSLQIKHKNGYDKCFSRYPLLVDRFKEIVDHIKNKTGNVNRAYVWGTLCGVDLAKKLGFNDVSVIEFGVARGRGLLSLEEITLKIEKIYGLTVNVYGFDTGHGLPKPKDYRDLPHLWNEGFFDMDQEKLQQRLKKGKLIMGHVKDTIPDFIESKPAPVAFISFDMDLYSSTMEAFKLFEADQGLLLPRIHCYFDDIMGYSYGDFNGERLAISDFNKRHEIRKISKIYNLSHYIHETFWPEKMFLAHIFDHALYSENDGMVQCDRQFSETV